MKKIIGITGTTCVGKSAVAVRLAKLLHSEIISADSMQIYKGMDIGTAKVTKAEMDGVPHHMLDIVLPNQNYSSFEYANAASKIIDNSASIPIVVGGTGFYFDSLVFPPEFGAGNRQRRAELQEIFRREGLDALCEKLKMLDFESYGTIDLKNPVRVIRAIEIAEQGQKRSAGTRDKQPAKYDLQLYVLYRDRAELYAMIDERVDRMIANGLVDEVRKMVKDYGFCETTAFSAIGYKEIISHLQGNCSLIDAVKRIKLNTRHYAKRQETYFKKMQVEKRIDVASKNVAEVADIIYNDFM